LKGTDIRELFLGYFAEREHTRVASSSLVPQNDPTLFFTNAGMVPFKDVFLGNESRGYNRAASSQKCMRVSGKHNDLENVGRTARHHTFFEMLGNFSFGDYFKKEAILFGWEFLTKIAGLPADELIVTVFTDDDEAHTLWQEAAGVPDERIFRLGEKDNFWSMGDTGPCGPCSEILIDQGEGMGCGLDTCGADCDCGRFLELWNLVFMQFNRDSSGNMTPLPRPSIDTGMGLERLAAVMQGKDSNYHTDLLLPFVEEASRISKIKYGSADESDVSMRVIADHVRAVTFLVADGVLPSNEGRGYVLRRIMRRAARHGKLLGIDDAFLHRMCPLVGEVLGDGYPEVIEGMETITKVVELEEERFSRTIDQGLRRLEELMEQVKASGGSQLPGDEVFKLYDTYGFPLDLSQDIAAEGGMGVDEGGFGLEMEAQKSRARASWSGSGEEDVPQVYRDLAAAGTVTFTGYDEDTTDGAAIAGIAVDGEMLDSWTGSGEVEIVLDRTPFYGESGGQAGDTGVLEIGAFSLAVTDTIKPLADLTVHRCNSESEITINRGDSCRAAIDAGRRNATRRNHTATHLLHRYLKDVLGEHVKQSGSLVEPERFRFDFTHFEAMTGEEIQRLEDLVNESVLANLEVETRVMPMDDAVAMGAVALFGEKYADDVRVVSVQDVSSELCGGTHAARTGDIGLFKVIMESSIAAGVRRLEGITGTGVMDYLRSEEGSMQEMADSVKVPVHELPARLRKLLDTVSDQDRKIKELQRSIAAGGSSDLMDDVREVDGIRYLAAEVAGQDPASLRETADNLKDRLGSGVVLLAAVDGGKVFLVAAVTKDLIEKVSASDLIGRLGPMVGGGGGGRPDMAQAGGKDPDGLPGLLDNVENAIREIAQ
jgi:alanyl-tRNA synthetase